MVVKEKILEASSHYTPKQLMIGKYICEHLYDVALMNSPRIAQEVGVSEATLTRFIYATGYENFSDFQLDVRKDVQKPDPCAVIRLLEKNNTELPAYNDVINVEKTLLDELKESLSSADFKQFVDDLIDAKRVIIVSSPMDRYLTDYLADYLIICRNNVSVVTKRDMSYLGFLSQDSEKTVAVMVCYPRYPKDVIEIAKNLKKYGVKILAITDSLSSPLIPFADVKILIPVRYIHFVTPHAAGMTFIHSVLIEIYRRNNKRINQRMAKYEEAIEASDIFALRDLRLGAL